MRVLQVNANYGFGSTGLIVKDIGTALVDANHEAYFAYQKTNEEVETGYQIGNKLDWKFHATLCRILGRQGYYSTIPTYRFTKYLDSINPDIVHLHNLHSNYVNVDYLFSYLAQKDIPTVLTMHDCWYFTGKCFHYVDCGCNRFQTGCGSCPKKDAPPKSLFFDWSKHLLAKKRKSLLSIPRLKVVGCSQWICNEARKSFLKDCNIQCIYNGVDTAIFKPTESDIREKCGCHDDYLVMGMANKWMLESNRSLISKISQLAGIKLMLVGCTEAQIEYLKQHEEKVIAVGFIRDRKELAAHYSAADVFVNLTHADTLPTVNMESICCGTPVITYNSCGSPELLDDETGCVVEENDQDGVVAKIGEFSRKKFLNCRAVGVNRFDRKRCYTEYLKVYSEFLK